MKVLSSLVLFLYLGSVSFAQSVAGLGAISGTVLDGSGARVPNAEVVITNAERGIRRSLTTNEAGLFNAGSLTPAEGYIISVSKTGFNRNEAKSVVLQVGQLIDLKFTLNVATSTTTIEVSAEGQNVDTAKTGVSQVVNEAQILNLPINGRRVDSFVLLTPGVTNDGTFGALSFRGMPGGNAFLQDGNDSTQQYYNENSGRTRISANISQDTVQ